MYIIIKIFSNSILNVLYTVTIIEMQIGPVCTHTCHVRVVYMLL